MQGNARCRIRWARTVIPEAAIEAIARASVVEVYGVDIFDGMSDDAQGILRKRGTLLLEAAAPHMLAEAWGEGRVVGMMDPHRIEHSIKLNAPEYAQVANPYR